MELNSLRITNENIWGAAPVSEQTLRVQSDLIISMLLENADY